MQKEFARHFPSLKLQIIGINEKGQESGNASVTNGRNLPWLQDVDANPQNDKSDVWYDSWKITFRDVVVVDRAGNEVGRYNLTSNSLGVEANYNTMKQMFLDSAKNPPKTEWQCPVEPLDVTGDSRVELSDALQIINAVQLRTYPNGQLPSLNGGVAPTFYDVTGDMNVTLQDAIQVINHLALVFQPSAALSATVSSDPGLADATGDSVVGVNLRAEVSLQASPVRQVSTGVEQASLPSIPALQTTNSPVPSLQLPSLQSGNQQRFSATGERLFANDADNSARERMVDELFAQGW